MNLFVYCSGGFGKEVMDIARRLNHTHSRWNQIAFLDDERKEASHYGAIVFTLKAALDRFGASQMEVVIASGEPFVRKNLLEKLDSAHVRLATLIDGSAVVSESATIGEGSIVSPGCYLSSGTIIGRNVAFAGGGALMAHDSQVGDNCVLAGQANIAGRCVIGTECFLGMGSQIREQTRIGNAVIVGMGSVVLADIPDETIAFGNPCRPVRHNRARQIFR